MLYWTDTLTTQERRQVLATEFVTADPALYDVLDRLYSETATGCIAADLGECLARNPELADHAPAMEALDVILENLEGILIEYRGLSAYPYACTLLQDESERLRDRLGLKGNGLTVPLEEDTESMDILKDLGIV